MLADAAHVQHGIAHRSITLGAIAMGVGVGIGAILLGAAYVFAAPITIPATLAGAATMAVGAAAVVSVWSSFTILGTKLGEAFSGTDPHAGGILDGARSVMLGTQRLYGAFASSTCLVDCHSGAYVDDGSTTVSYENHNASRKGDKTSCGGTISEGEPDIHIGGDHSNTVDVPDRPPRWYEIASGTLDTVDFVASLPTRGAANIALWGVYRTFQALGWRKMADAAQIARQLVKLSSPTGWAKGLDASQKLVFSGDDLFFW